MPLYVVLACAFYLSLPGVKTDSTIQVCLCVMSSADFTRISTVLTWIYSPRTCDDFVARATINRETGLL